MSCEGVTYVAPVWRPLLDALADVVELRWWRATLVNRAIVAGWVARSARVRRERPGLLDLAYGDSPRERIRRRA